MAKVKETNEVEQRECNHKNNSISRGDGVYGLGTIGALFYYLPHAQSFQEGVLGIVKAAFWPAFLVYKLIELLKF